MSPTPPQPLAFTCPFSTPRDVRPQVGRRTDTEGGRRTRETVSRPLALRVSAPLIFYVIVENATAGEEKVFFQLSFQSTW